ncbi:MAG: type II secretion system protein GspK [Desulfobacteraceae bacterium]|jgi:general secretion pathway protein K
MNLSGLKNNRGVALLITLSIITILVTVGLELNRRTKATVDAAATLKDRFTLTQMATGAIHTGMALLIKDAKDTQIDSVQEDWADPDKIEQMLNEIPFDDGKVSLVISDELAKIQVNALVDFPEGTQFNITQRALWERFMDKLLKLYKETEDVSDMEETDSETIINSLKDWLDSKDDDAVTGLSGAESDYYMGLDNPYKCKNGPFSHLGEVALVKGIPPELFNGFGDLLGLSNFLTIYGAVEAGAGGTTDSDSSTTEEITESDESKEADFTYEGKININTADLPVLMALLPAEASEFAKNLYDYRIAKAGDETYLNDLSQEGWYQNVPGFAGLTIEDEENLITLSSSIFRITATAIRFKAQLTLTAIVQRQKDKESGKWECKVLNWLIE